ncbi:LacI family DNA-binding transcriptional regulator [Gulosibacter sp. ACHW.36C]|uniref:LacI family transcriptional regulator n=1 Tax=Gulosibacter sediminis TaxID=1729695 RepID=A0ABY4MUS1_9MICO|nr:LacI family DNA-binding transcriptional regulator [Gulosibacter sediminis]UQN14162.1 LacI family transcriptional regulator [Gulosibacter sediminis]
MTNASGQVVTLRDVAAAAGVSVSTVSRALDDRLPSSKGASAERIRELASSLGYRRNVYASGLRRGATGTIGVLVPRLTDVVMSMLFESLERAGRAKGYFAVVATCGDDQADEQRATETLLDRNVDGLVLATARLDDVLTSSLRDRQIPHVLALRTDRRSPSVLGDDETGGYLAVRHLVDLGHRDIAMIMGPEFASSAVDRLEGARRAFAEAGLELPESRIRSGSYSLEEGYRAGAELIDTEAPTAIFAANDNLAIGALRAAHERGLTPGRDISIVGYNDIPLASRLPVPLTSVHTAFDQIASAAIELLLAGDAEPPRAPERIMPTLIPRASTALPRA